MLFHAGGYCEHVRVEYDVERVHAHLFRQQAVGACRYGCAPLKSGGLPLFIEAHHDNCRAMSAHVTGVCQKRVLALLERYGVHDALALDAFQAGHDNVPVRRVDHKRHASHVWFGSEQVQESCHFRFRIEQAIVHVDVDGSRAVGHLFTGDANGFGIILFLYQSKELA